MLFTDIANYKKSLDNALTPFNENIKTKILLNINNEHFSFNWTDSETVESEIKDRCGEAVLEAIKKHDFEFGLLSWHTASITYINVNGKEMAVTAMISID